MAIFVLDLLTPLGMMVGGLYLLPLLLTAWMPQRHAPLLLAMVFTGLVLLGTLLSPHGAPFETWGTNRAMSIGGVWAVAAFLVQRRRAEAASQHRQETLEHRVAKRTADLQQAINFLEKDIVKRKQVEGNLAQMAAIVESSDDAIISKSLDGIVLSWNKGAERLFGYAAQETIGEPITFLIPPERVDEETQILKRIREGERIEHRETIRRKNNGLEILVSLTVSPIKNKTGEIIGISKICRDISALAQANKMLRLAYAQLLTVSSQMDTVQEDERKNIAREIHDELGHSMTALKLDIAWCTRRLTAMPESVLRVSLLDKIRSMAALLDLTNQTVRKIVGALRPRVLDELGLVAALESLAAEWQTHTNVRLKVAISPQARAAQIDSVLSITLFRIAQELLTNVMRHASASAATISLTQTDDMLVLEVRDNGRGITAAHKSTSLGLVGMRERASRMGGDFTIKGEPEKGTVAIARIPFFPPPC